MNSVTDQLRTYARSLGAVPGVYRMLGAEDALLYVGKAKNLKKRVESYFTRALDTRLAAMVDQIRRIEVMLTRTEAEALLLEAQLIKNLKPRYNLDLRDDKSYPYIHITGDAAFPWLRFHRGSKAAPGQYFGPFPSAAAVRDCLDSLFRTFRLRSCEDSVFKNRSRPCLQYQIKRCSAPCVGLISEPDYAASLRHAEWFLSGRSNQVVDEMIARMDRAASQLEYEQAADWRDRVSQLKRVQAKHYVSDAREDLDVIGFAQQGGTACVQILVFRNGLNLGNRSHFLRLPLDADLPEVRSQFLMQYYAEHECPSEVLLRDKPESPAALQQALSELVRRKVKLSYQPRSERLKWLELAERTAEQQLISRLQQAASLAQRFTALNALLGTGKSVRRIECFDISHTMGEATVASCVVFDEEGARKMDYRRFNISGITPGDDYAAMHAALRRRFKRLQQGEGTAPDLLLIDGGAGQLKQAFEVLDELGLPNILAVGVAKGEARRAGHETLIVGRNLREVFPGPESLASHLIQQVRDEAHRFAITGHRQQRGKARLRSPLEDIAGIGPKRRSQLLKAFGGIRGVAKAGIDELIQVAGVNRELAERICARMREA